MISPSSAILIVNPQAGRRRQKRPAEIQRVKMELQRAGIEPIVWETTQPGDGVRLAAKAVESSAEMVVVCGGDGTINEVVGGLAHSHVPLAILPGGTANVLARELGLPLDIPSAARRIPGSTPRRVSLGRAGERYFLMMAGIGFDAAVVRRINGSAKKLLGMGTYFLEGFFQLWAQPPARFALRTEQGTREATFACISKTKHYGPVRMVPEADLFSDQFYVYCFPSRSQFRYLAYAWAVITSKASRLQDVERFPARCVLCEPDGDGGQVYLQLDGEFAGQLPCRIEIVPDALTLLVPDVAAG